MDAVIIEIKARCADPERIRAILRDRNARFVGEDHQVDTYFVVPKGRLKLRQGTIENTLIQYHRPDQEGPKRSDVRLFRTTAETDLKRVLDGALETLVVVDKRREIYFIDNVKFHIDRVVGLGSFIEIEAIDETGERSPDKLQAQCEGFLDLFAIDENDLVDRSYSDLLMARRAG